MYVWWWHDRKRPWYAVHFPLVRRLPSSYHPISPASREPRQTQRNVCVNSKQMYIMVCVWSDVKANRVFFRDLGIEIGEFVCTEEEGWPIPMRGSRIATYRTFAYKKKHTYTSRHLNSPTIFLKLKFLIASVFCM